MLLSSGYPSTHESDITLFAIYHYNLLTLQVLFTQSGSQRDNLSYLVLLKSLLFRVH